MDYSKFFNKSEGTTKTATQATPQVQQPPKPTYTEGDKQFVQFLKSKGATAEGAFSALKEAKRKYGDGGAALQDFQNQLKNPLWELGVGAVKGIGSTLSGMSEIGQNMLSDITGIKPAGGVAKIPDEMLKPEGTWQGIGFGAEQLGEFLVPAGKVVEAGKLLSNTAVKGLTASQKATLLATKGLTAAEKTAIKATKTLGTGGKMLKGAVSLVPESAVFATQAGFQKGTMKDFISDATSAFAFGVGLKTIGAAYKGLTGAEAQRLKAKVGGATGETIKNMSDEKLGKLVLEKLDDAKNALDDPTSFKNPLQRVGQEELKPALDALIQANSGVGANLGSIIRKAKKAYIFTDDAAKAFQKSVEKIGGKITPDGVVFPPTMISKTAKDVEKLNEVWTQISKGTRTSMTPDEVWQLSQSIDDFVREQGSANVLKEITNASEIPLGVAREALHNSLIKAVPDSTSLFKKFSEQRGVIDWFNKKLGTNASSASVIKNIFSPLAKDEAVPMFKSLGKMTGKDLLLQSKAAKTAMEIVGDSRALGLLEIASNPTKSGFFNAARGLVFNQERAVKALFKALHKTAPKSGSKEMEYLIDALRKSMSKSGTAEDLGNQMLKPLSTL